MGKTKHIILILAKIVIFWNHLNYKTQKQNNLSLNNKKIKSNQNI